jgi:hypothetical protein
MAVTLANLTDSLQSSIATSNALSVSGKHFPHPSLARNLIALTLCGA